MMILLKRDKITTKYDNFLYIGDLNYDFFYEKNVDHW